MRQQQQNIHIRMGVIQIFPENPMQQKNLNTPEKMKQKMTVMCTIPQK